MSSTLALISALTAVFVTSLLSGIVGMAGGLTLIVILVLLMPVPSAMILHGIVQGVANGSRFWFLRHHTVWRIIPLYFIGVAIASAFFALTAIVADSAVVLILAGGLPWLSQFTPQRFRLDVTHPVTSLMCGVITTAAVLLSGTSGPLLDAFYQRTKLNRFQIVATKALTQAVGHVVKIVYFLFVSATVPNETHPLLSWWFITLAVVLSLVGTKMGTTILSRLDEARFRKTTNALILALGACVVMGGVYDLLTR